MSISRGSNKLWTSQNWFITSSHMGNMWYFSWILFLRTERWSHRKLTVKMARWTITVEIVASFLRQSGQLYEQVSCFSTMSTFLQLLKIQLSLSGFWWCILTWLHTQWIKQNVHQFRTIKFNKAEFQRGVKLKIQTLNIKLSTIYVHRSSNSRLHITRRFLVDALVVFVL